MTSSTFGQDTGRGGGGEARYEGDPNADRAMTMLYHLYEYVGGVNSAICGHRIVSTCPNFQVHKVIQHALHRQHWDPPRRKIGRGRDKCPIDIHAGNSKTSAQDQGIDSCSHLSQKLASSRLFILEEPSMGIFDCTANFESGLRPPETD